MTSDGNLSGVHLHARGHKCHGMLHTHKLYLYTFRFVFVTSLLVHFMKVRAMYIILHRCAKRFFRPIHLPYSKVSVKFRGKGPENFGRWIYTSFFILHDAQPQATRHSSTTKATQLQSEEIVSQIVSQVNMANTNAPPLSHRSCRLWSSGLWCRALLLRVTSVSEKRLASILINFAKNCCTWLKLTCDLCAMWARFIPRPIKYN
jgi:hypothetical protein